MMHFVTKSKIFLNGSYIMHDVINMKSQKIEYLLLLNNHKVICSR